MGSYILRLEFSVFLKNFGKFFFDILIPFEKIFPGSIYIVVLKFLLEVPKFKDNVLICMIIVIKVCDRLLTLL